MDNIPSSNVIIATNQPSMTPLDSSSKNKLKSKDLFLIISVIVAFALVGFGGYLLGLNSSDKTDSLVTENQYRLPIASITITPTGISSQSSNTTYSPSLSEKIISITSEITVSPKASLLSIKGYVRLGSKNGPGVEGVSIYMGIATYEAQKKGNNRF